MSWNLPLEISTTQKGYNILAVKIADTIADWLGNNRIIEAKNKPVQAGDIMILIRKRANNKLVDALFTEFKKRDIPCAGMDRMKLTEHIAVMDLIALAKFLLLPQDDLTLATILKSPLVNISEERLFELCYKREKSLWQRVNEQEKEIAEYLASLLNMVDFTAPYELFSHILKDGQKKLASRLGEDINDPINEFLNLALEYEKKHIPSLQGFIHWIEKGNIEIKRDMEQGKDEVRILTVHGSKGLQAPIIILPDTAKLPAKTNLSKLIWQDGFPLYSPSDKECNDICRERKDNIIKKQEEEYRRLLYVALTRAEDELYICADEKAKDGSWYELVSAIETTKAVDSCGRGKALSLPLGSHGGLPLQQKSSLPPFATTPAPKEPTPSNPLAPSKLDDEFDTIISPLVAIDNKRYERGTVIHKLLQYLPDVELSKRENMAIQIAKNSELTDEQQKDAIANAFKVMQEFTDIFEAPSMAEVSVSGVVNDRVISGQIDRLIIKDNTVVIIDFKTNRIFSDKVSKKYEKQMGLYAKLLAKIYPEKEIKTYLLWTEFPKMIEVNYELV